MIDGRWLKEKRSRLQEAEEDEGRFERNLLRHFTFDERADKRHVEFHPIHKPARLKYRNERRIIFRPTRSPSICGCFAKIHHDDPDLPQGSTTSPRRHPGSPWCLSTRIGTLRILLSRLQRRSSRVASPAIRHASFIATDGVGDCGAMRNGPSTALGTCPCPCLQQRRSFFVVRTRSSLEQACLGVSDL